MSTGDSGRVMQLGCPTCGAVLTVTPSATPGRSWVALLPCPSCRAYAAHVVMADGTSRSRIVDGAPLVQGVGRSG